MSFLFGSTKTPEIKYTPPPVLPAPLPKEEEVVEKEKKKLRRGSTRRSTLLTGPLGLLEPANITTKTLLGE